jgi:hypothetical protein
VEEEQKQQRQLEEGLKGVLFLVAGASYLRTKSLIETGIYVSIAMLLTCHVSTIRKSCQIDKHWFFVKAPVSLIRKLIVH